MAPEKPDRPLPVNLGAERSILGSILLDSKAYDEASGELRPEHLSLDSHRRVYKRMMDLARAGQPIDLITLIEELDRHKDLEAIGGAAYVSGLLDGVPDRPSIKHYITIVRDKALRRDLIRGAYSIIENAYENAQPVEVILTESEAALRRLANGQTLTAGLSRISSWSQIPTLERLPVRDVSWAIEGMAAAGSVVLWAGESGSYKTWLALWLAKTVLEGNDFLGRKTAQRPVLYLDRENPLSLIQERCSILGICSSEDFRIWGGWERDPPPTIGDRRLLQIAEAMRPLIVFDSFIRFHGAEENSATEMGRVMGEVRALANTGSTVIILHHKPKAEGTQYRGSSDIKAGVDVAFAVAYEKEQETLTIQCFKNRFGEELNMTVKPQLDSGQLFEVTQDEALRREHEAEQMLCKVIEGQPRLNQGEVVRMSGLPAHKARLILKRCEGRLWRTEQGPRGRHEYYLLTSESSLSGFQPYSSEKLKSSGVDSTVMEGEL